VTTEQTGATPQQQASGPDTASIIDAVRTVLDDMKAEDIVSIDLLGKSSIADLLVIASGRSSRQVASTAGRIEERLKSIGVNWLRSEGLPQADWVLIDAGDVIVHLFRPEVREFYNIEKMWNVAMPTRPVVEVYDAANDATVEDDFEEL
jgi:ribosome-associated protein